MERDVTVPRLDIEGGKPDAFSPEQANQLAAQVAGRRRDAQIVVHILDLRKLQQALLDRPAARRVGNLPGQGRHAIDQGNLHRRVGAQASNFGADDVIEGWAAHLTARSVGSRGRLIVPNVEGIALDQGTSAGRGLGAEVRAGPDIGAGPSLDEKVAFLSQAAAYPSGAGPVARRETHMSWVFFVDSAVYKLKKPVRFDYLDFSTLPQREAACRSEFALNQRLAPDVYHGVAPLVCGEAGLRLGGSGPVVDWLVVMRRLDETHTLEARLLAHSWTDGQLDSLAATLARFYRHARRVGLAPAAHLARWRTAVAENGRVLLDPRLGLPRGLVRRLIATQWRFLRSRPAMLAARSSRIVDGHGDLRPEHIWVGSAVKMIDRLEFSAALRAVDPLDELAFLDLECERLGAPEVGVRLRRRLLAGLHERTSPELYLFYRIYRALLRARLSIAHLLEPNPRTPEKWPRQARSYLALAARDARRLDRLLRRPAGR